MRVRVRHGFWCAAVTWGLILFSSAGGLKAADSLPPSLPEVVVPIPHPMTMLLRAQAVQRELGLEARQVAAITALVEKADLRLWRLRDLAPEERNRAADPLLQSLRTELSEFLTGRPRERFEQLVLQSQGVRAILVPEVAATVGLSDDQMQTIRVILFAAARRGRPVYGPDLEAERNVLMWLTERQRRTFAQLMGPPFDFSRVPNVACRAPELERVTAWINSTPLTLRQLRPKVVAVHFYTFGCVNCIRNLPYYNDWQNRFDRNRFAIVGIHRPETEGERDIEKVRQKAEEACLTYPIAVDNDSRNWGAWANRVWPSVYLIDKNGFVRYWWYGELNWQGVQGHVWMRERIAGLLAEPISQPADNQRLRRPGDPGNVAAR